ncbi:hypothetical protein BDD14_5899 [Edaphobacter modestus]|uniref:Uncharacterized protein n=1 Tax=Edaphobacter modestus TaxID=388466 RepID=A0A4Q7YEJ0_9BACT|nr:hypothetical protein BDD14_5899 [Edaphobacter modestus]
MPTLNLVEIFIVEVSVRPIFPYWRDPKDSDLNFLPTFNVTPHSIQSVIRWDDEGTRQTKLMY